MRVSEIRVKRIRVNQGLGVCMKFIDDLCCGTVFVRKIDYLSR